MIFPRCPVAIASRASWAGEAWVGCSAPRIGSWGARSRSRCSTRLPAWDAARIERFWEEGRIASQLEHPAIVPIYDLGRTADLEPFITMKLVLGRTLREHLRADLSPEPERQRRLGWFLQVCQAVAYAHDRGVIHRDLKPANIMVGRFGEVHVMDWGLARIVAEGEDPAPRARSPHFPDAWETATGAAAGRRATWLPSRRAGSAPAWAPTPTSTRWGSS